MLAARPSAYRTRSDRFAFRHVPAELKRDLVESRRDASRKLVRGGEVQLAPFDHHRTDQCSHLDDREKRDAADQLLTGVMDGLRAWQTKERRFDDRLGRAVRIGDIVGAYLPRQLSESTQRGADLLRRWLKVFE